LDPPIGTFTLITWMPFYLGETQTVTISTTERAKDRVKKRFGSKIGFMISNG